MDSAARGRARRDAAGFLLAGFSLAAILLAGPPPTGAETARVRSAGRWQLEPARTVAELALPGVGEPARDRFGGRLDTKREATGFFRVERVGGTWWLVDPEGRLFLSAGVTTVTPGSLEGGVVPARGVPRAGWARETATLLREHGFNTLGSWSNDRIFRERGVPLPYTPQWNFIRTYREERRRAYGNGCSPKECLPVFDPEFEAFCDARARQLEETRDDPWLLGHFSDNELPFPAKALDAYLDLPRSDPGFAAASSWWERFGGGRPRREIDGSARGAFLEFLARRYYATVGAAIRRHDPNHLYLGSRLHGQALVKPVFVGSDSLDVVSVNLYHAWSPDLDRTADWVRWSGRPYLVSEWYAEVDEQGVEGGGAGFKVAGERDQALFYQNFTLGLLADPGCVGWQWFKYSADADGHPHGIVTASGEPRPVLLDAMAEVNRAAYRISDRLRGPPPTVPPEPAPPAAQAPAPDASR